MQKSFNMQFEADNKLFIERFANKVIGFVGLFPIQKAQIF
jgi:hypothetical protein